MFISSAFAQDTPTPSATGTTSATSDMPAAPYELSQEKMFADTLVFLVLLFFVFYFILIRPQQKKFKQHQDMLGELQKGDEVITGGGIIGKIHKFEGEDVVILELAENLRVKVARASISEKYREPLRPAPAKEVATGKKTANDN